MKNKQNPTQCDNLAGIANICALADICTGIKIQSISGDLVGKRIESPLNCCLNET